MKTLSLKTTPQLQVVSQAVNVLQAGGLLVYPTETVYGLGVDATNQEAVDKLLKFKGQRELKPILIAVSDQNMAEEYVELNSVAQRLYRMFLPGPVAVVSRKRVPQATRVARVTQVKKKFANGIASLEGTVGIRIPDYPLILNIIRSFGKPITTTSANISGARNPWSVNDITKTTPMGKLEFIDLILDAGQLPKRPPSTIVDTSKEKTEIVREGMVDLRSWIVDPKSKTKPEILVSRSPEETKRVGEELMYRMLSGDPRSIIHHPRVLALQGPLGAGKTVFAKGVARALGVTEPIRSPSYMLVREYKIPKKFSTLYHVDAWRLSDPSELQDLSLESMLKPGNIIVIEWIDRLAPIFNQLKQKAKVIFVEINVLNNNQRTLKIAR